MSTDPRPRATPSWTVAFTVCVASLGLLGSLAAGGAPSRADASGPTGPGRLSAADDTVDTPGLGCGSAEVTKTLASGSAWRMCARIDSNKGLVLEQIQFRPATGDHEYQGWLPVIDSLYLAQLVVPYDTDDAAFNDVTDYGFGDEHLLAQTDQTCPGQTMPVEQSFLWGLELVERTIPGICLDEVEHRAGLGRQGGGRRRRAAVLPAGQRPGGLVAHQAQLVRVPAEDHPDRPGHRHRRPGRHRGPGALALLR